jgi:hypothetical protein
MQTPHVINYFAATETVSATLGGINRTYPATGVAMSAFVQFRTDSIAIVNQTEGNNVMALIYVNGLFAAKAYDRINYNGVWYEVMAVVPGNGPRGTQYTRLSVGENEQI